MLDWATTKGYREGENPVRSVTKGLPKQKDDAEHFTALPYVEVPAFLSRLRETNQTGPVVKLAMEFLILTAVRSGEMRNARWFESKRCLTTRPRPFGFMKYSADCRSVEGTSMSGTDREALWRQHVQAWRESGLT
ncbi:hypothetical protein QSG27_29195, partial [Azospirillum sp. C340-1]|nr:hypothetical protein [Azospirillum isscasi]